LVSLFRRRNFQKGGYWTEWKERTKTPDVHFTATVRTSDSSERPERFELPTFWFVVAKSGNPKVLQVSHLQVAPAASVGPQVGTRACRVHEKGEQTGYETLSGPQVGSTTEAAIEDA
jgi:hypothetical protein